MTAQELIADVSYRLAERDDSDSQGFAADLNQALIALAQNVEVGEESDPSCRRCGSQIVNGSCEDETCPYSDHPQNDERFAHEETRKEG